MSLSYNERENTLEIWENLMDIKWERKYFGDLENLMDIEWVKQLLREMKNIVKQKKCFSNELKQRIKENKFFRLSNKLRIF